MEKQLNELKANQVRIQTDIGYIKESISDIKTCMKEDDKRHVTINRFRPIEMIAYGLAGGTLMWALSQVLETVKALEHIIN